MPDPLATKSSTAYVKGETTRGLYLTSLDSTVLNAFAMLAEVSVIVDYNRMTGGNGGVYDGDEYQILVAYYVCV